MPSYPHRFQPGDTVTIRAWDDILSQYGSFSGEYSMKQYCGRSFKVEHVRPSINDKYWIYMLDCCYFPFTEDMFVVATPVPASPISFDDLMKGATL